MIKDLLAKLGANTKITVGVSVTPGVGLEMIEIDKLTKTVNKYACKPLEYNYSSREIMNYEAFQETLEELFEELHIPKKSNIILNMPNVHFGTINLPLLLTDDAITNAIISEVEQSYIFKRQEPIVSWVEINSNLDTENRTLAYTAFQQSAMDGIKACCQEIGCTLIALESSYASMLKTLQYSELAKDQLKENVTWNLMIIGQNNYSIFSMSGKKLIEYYEEPLALKSFVDDEIYNAITTSAQLTLSGLPANYLFIISETDSVSAEVLSMKLPFEGTMKFLECNKYTQNEIIPANLNILPNIALKISPEAIGCGIYQFGDFPLKFNLTGEEITTADKIESGEYPRINIGNVEVELTPDFIKKIALIVGVPMVVITITLAFAIGAFVNTEQAKLTQISTKVDQYNQEIAKYNVAAQGNSFDANATSQKITQQNRTNLFYYGALGMSIPNKLWITYYMTNATNGIDIKGKATDVESIYSFYKNLKQLVTKSDIRLYKLEVESSSVDDVIGNSSNGPRYYQFEITNMTEADLNPAAATAGASGAPGATTTPGAPGATTTPGAATAPGGPTNPAAPTPTAPGATTAPGAPGGPTNPAAPTPTATPTSSAPGQLPKNLEKIEKF